MQFFKDLNLNIVGKRRIAYVFSAVLILAGLFSLLFHGGVEYGIDFTGGTALQVKFEKTMDAGDIRNALTDIGLGDAEIKRLGLEDVNEFLIRVEQRQEGAEVAQLMEQELIKDFSDNPYEIISVNEVGPKIGGELRRAAFWAVFVSLIGILIYISWRFEFKFAVGAVVALFHDVLITLGIFSILNLEITLSVVAAFLTIVGYSLNDTIVVYDRIRENIKVLRRDNFTNLVNTSLNQTISRTVITSVTTFIVVLVLYIFGGEVIHNFALALLIGVLIGTYSSIFVASSLVLDWRLRDETQKSKKLTARKSK